jgi:hypothetical protein
VFLGNASDNSDNGDTIKEDAQRERTAANSQQDLLQGRAYGSAYGK